MLYILWWTKFLDQYDNDLDKQILVIYFIKTHDFLIS